MILIPFLGFFSFHWFVFSNFKVTGFFYLIFYFVLFYYFLLNACFFQTSYKKGVDLDVGGGEKNIMKER